MYIRTSKIITNGNRKSQVQLGESIAVTVVIIILLMVGLVFWNKLQTDDASRMVRDAETRAIIELSKNVAEMPELKCYRTLTASDVGCIDWYKALAMNESMEDAQVYRYYTNIFKTSRITLHQTYPTNVTLTIYDNNITSTRKLQITIPVTIEVMDSNVENVGRIPIKNFGLLTVEGYYR